MEVEFAVYGAIEGRRDFFVGGRGGLFEGREVFEFEVVWRLVVYKGEGDAVVDLFLFVWGFRLGGAGQDVFLVHDAA